MQSGAIFTGFFKSSDSLSAVIFRLNSGAGPLFGRPRWLMRMSEAPSPKDVLDRGQGLADARVVGDLAALDRHVESTRMSTRLFLYIECL